MADIDTSEIQEETSQRLERGPRADGLRLLAHMIARVHLAKTKPEDESGTSRGMVSSGNVEEG